ncbi:hypothetical protein I8748_17490 [Nostoc sp. CENA67]|uniref:Uncharacterized protein n=1 Tax=Amazonocrinis nigriterrae CENA67 TaxID=2794033 RepID=A0A8J7HTP9_9NOST|nr:hypothetical protein [Amazonocrinis nigriterrae]MBH8563955.1 hypothetical protein [Amazonocrinis nigriterrae CENA67]
MRCAGRQRTLPALLPIWNLPDDSGSQCCKLNVSDRYLVQLLALGSLCIFWQYKYGTISLRKSSYR